MSSATPRTAPHTSARRSAGASKYRRSAQAAASIAAVAGMSDVSTAACASRFGSSAYAAAAKMPPATPNERRAMANTSESASADHAMFARRATSTILRYASGRRSLASSAPYTPSGRTAST